MRRRWTVLVLVPALVIGCCGGIVAAPLGWIVKETAAAGRGAATPTAAADEYLMALGYGQEEGLLPLLDDEDQDELLKQWRTYRAQMEGTDPPPARLDFDALEVGPIKDGRAEVSTDVSATWWNTEGERTSFYRSQQHRWVIETHDDGGWRVSAVHAPAWCGGYVLAAKCRTR